MNVVWRIAELLQIHPIGNYGGPFRPQWRKPLAHLRCGCNPSVDSPIQRISAHGIKQVPGEHYLDPQSQSRRSDDGVVPRYMRMNDIKRSSFHELLQSDCGDQIRGAPKWQVDLRL